MVVIIDAGPRMFRKGRNATRSIKTPSPPENSMVTANVASSTPTSGNPVSAAAFGMTPNSSNMPRPTKLPTMNTLKWAKLINSRMPYTSVNPSANRAYMAPRLRPLMACCR